MEKIIDEKYKEVLKFIKENLEKGYNIYSNIDDINEIINIIVMWYKIKYPEELLIFLQNESLNNKNNINIEISNVEKLSLYMGYYELMLRIPRRLHSIIECWYKDSKNTKYVNDSFADLWKNDLNKKSFNYLNNSIIISEENLKSGDKISIEIDKYDGSIKYLYYNLLKDLIKIDCKKIEEFDNINNKKDTKFKKLRDVVLTHNIDLQLRDKIFELIGLKLLFSTDDIKRGYIRAKNFINEFNKYINNLNLKLSLIDKQVNGFNYIKNFVHEVNFMYFNIYNKKNNSSKLLDEYGLSFRTLHFLRENNILKPEELEEISVYENLDISFDDIINLKKAIKNSKNDKTFYLKI